MTAGLILIALAALIAGPLALRPERASEPPGADRLVIVTPHNEQIRTEIELGFVRWMARQHGRRVAIDWRTPGGTSEIRALLESQYTAAFESGRLPIDAAAPAGVMPYDLMLGGGTYEHGRLKRGVRVTIDGASAQAPLSAVIPIPPGTLHEWYGENRIGANTLYDPDRRWLGVTLSSFGVLYNRDRVAELGLPEPATWADLADPRYRGWVALADPRQSGSIATTYEAILDANGWERGWRILRGMAANARYFSSSSTLPVIDISSGEAAAGLCIDFYGRYQAQAIGAGAEGGRLGFVEPAGQTRIDPDPASILRGGPNPELALRFVEFLLSLEGQAIWQFPVTADDEAMGPRRFALRRLPSRRVMYERHMHRFTDRVNPFEVAADTPPRGWRAMIGPLFGAAAVDTNDEMRDAWAALDRARRAGAPEAGVAALEDMFYSMPEHVFADGRRVRLTPEAYDEVAAEWRDRDRAAELRIEYTQFFAALYRDVARRADALAHPQG